jgi:hypothetical protein
MVHRSNPLCPLLRFLESASSQKNRKASDGHLRSALQVSPCKPNTQPLQCTRVYRLHSLGHRNTLAVARRFLPFHKPTTDRPHTNEATANRLCRVLHFLIPRLRLYNNREYGLQLLPLLTAHIPRSLSQVRVHVCPRLQGFQRLKWPDHPHIVPIHHLLGRPFLRTSCRLPREQVLPEASTLTHSTPMPKPNSKFKEILWR